MLTESASESAASAARTDEPVMAAASAFVTATPRHCAKGDQDSSCAFIRHWPASRIRMPLRVFRYAMRRCSAAVENVDRL